MTSRVLQEDSSLLLTEANEAVINDNFIATNSIVTGSPANQTTPISQSHTVSGSDLATSSPVLSTTAVTQEHQVTLSGITLGSVVISTTAVTQGHGLVSNSIVTSNTSVGTTDLSEGNVLTATGFITGSPSVSVANMDEEETATAPSFVTGIPAVGTATVTGQVHNLGAYSLLTRRPDIGTTADPNWIIKQEIEEIQQMFGGWPRRAYEVPDGRLVQAEREIEATFGDRVSVDRKAKSLIKFGKSGTLSTDRETVWNVGGNETYVTGNTITHVSSSSASDTQTLKLECHTVSGTGTNSRFTFVVQTVALNGQTPVALDTPVARISRMFNDNGTELVGNVYVYEIDGTTVTAGVPSPASKIHSKIDAGFQQGFKGATTFSNEDYYVLTGGFGSVSYKQSAAVDFYLEVRQAGKVFIEQAAVSANASGGSWQIDLDPAVIIPKNADVRITCESGSQGAVVYGSFKGYLAKVIG
jgi:hypothetical protein